MYYPFPQGAVDRVIVPFARWLAVDPSVIAVGQAISVVSSEKNFYQTNVK